MSGTELAERLLANLKKAHITRTTKSLGAFTGKIVDNYLMIASNVLNAKPTSLLLFDGSNFNEFVSSLEANQDAYAEHVQSILDDENLISLDSFKNLGEFLETTLNSLNRIIGV